jgi:hypothetical protein
MTAVPASREFAVGRRAHTMEPDLSFDPGTSITTVSVWSRFEDVSSSEAKTILDLSRPHNWAQAVPSFFVASDPVEFNVQSGKFEPAALVPSDVSADRRYKLREYVKWAWTPSTQGGIVNILDIHELAPKDSLLDDVCERVQWETKTTPIHRGGMPSRRPAVSYKYSLHRCLQSKFISNWEPGGLDVDQGHFTATWDDVSKTLFIEAVKKIRYSRQADVFPGFSSFLNMLAPAVTSMLMKHLAYESVVHYLERGRPGLYRENAFRTRERAEEGVMSNSPKSKESPPVGSFPGYQFGKSVFVNWANAVQQQASIWNDNWLKLVGGTYEMKDWYQAIGKSLEAGAASVEQMALALGTPSSPPWVNVPSASDVPVRVKQPLDDSHRLSVEHLTRLGDATKTADAKMPVLSVSRTGDFTVSVSWRYDKDHASGRYLGLLMSNKYAEPLAIMTLVVD